MENYRNYVSIFNIISGVFLVISIDMASAGMILPSIRNNLGSARQELF